MTSFGSLSAKQLNLSNFNNGTDYTLDVNADDFAIRKGQLKFLEITANEADYLREKLATLEANYYTLQESVRNSGFDTQNKYIPEKWEWQDMNDAITRVETMNQTIQQKQWEIDDLKTRIAYLEANLHNH